MLQKFNISILFLVMLFASTVAISQNKQTTSTSDSTTVDEPVRIADIDIIEQLVVANKDLKKIEQENETKRAIANIDSLLPPYIEFIGERKLLAQNFIEVNPNRQKIDNLISKWLGYRDLLNSWQTTVNSGELKKVILLDQVSQSENIWELTYQNAVEKEIPSEILLRIESVINSYETIGADITDERNKYLNLENQISDQIAVINEVVADLNNLKNSEVYNLFHLRNVPLWQIASLKEKETSLDKVGVESISRNISHTKTYLKSQQKTIYYFLILLFIVIVSVYLMRKNFLNYPPERSSKNLLKAKEIIVDNTIWLLLFLAFVLVRLFFPNTPKLFYDVLIVFMITSACILVQQRIHKRFKRIVYIFVLLWILYFAKNYIWLSAIQFRLYLLLETTVILGVILYITYPYLKNKRKAQSKLELVLVRFIPLAYILLAIAYVSNFLGYTNLTYFIIRIFVQGGDLALIFYAIIVMLNGMVLGFIHYHYHNRLPNFNAEEKREVENKMERIIRLAAIICWIFYFLINIDVYTPLSEFVLDIFSEPYKVGDNTFTIGTIFVFVAILIGSYFITRVVAFLLDGNVVKILSFNLPKGVPAAISLIIRYSILAFGIVLALSYLGIDLSKFNLLAGALGLGIGFGLQTIVSNFISGIILIFERPILPGDAVEVNNLLGTVSKIGVRASRINTYDGAEVVVPNNSLISNDLINWTLSDNIRRVEILISTAYGSDPNEILKVLEEVARENPVVLKDPAPWPLFDTFGKSSLKFRLLFWVYFQNGLGAKSDVSIAVYNRLKEMGIKISIPQHQVFLSKNDSSNSEPFNESES